MAKGGSTIGGLMDTIGTLTSMSLQYGVPLEALTSKFSHMRFEPSGWTGNQEIPKPRAWWITFSAGSGSVSNPVTASRTPRYRSRPNRPSRRSRRPRVISSIDDIEQSVAETVRRTLSRGDTGHPQPAVCPVPGRRTRVRFVRGDHRSQRQLLPVSQLREQHGM
ncbi:MAG: hypothetical protein Ct9H300mP1_00390 [Planctomycetaceae bacterium]|nr:MAG: hypothetical protein Ct9H300mP1_00390 [Planctomycetaceae bacterium]